MFYSPSTCGFYSSNVAADKMPSDVVKTTKEEYYALFIGTLSGKKIQVDKNGKLSLVDR